MTAPDSLERVLSDLRAHLECFSAEIDRIEALIPSKAEREFLEAAMDLASLYKRSDDEGAPLKDYDDALWAYENKWMAAYRALLAERGKDA